MTTVDHCARVLWDYNPGSWILSEQSKKIIILNLFPLLHHFVRSENYWRIFLSTRKSIEQRETKGGNQDQCKTATNIFISLFSEVTSVQQFLSAQCFLLCSKYSPTIFYYAQNDVTMEIKLK